MNEQPLSLLSSQGSSHLRASTSFTLGNETQVNGYQTQFNQQMPSISSLTDKTFLIAWYGIGWASLGDEIYVKKFNSAEQNLTDDVLVNTNISNTQQGSAVSSFPDGSGFVVAWHCFRNGTDSDIYMKIFNATTDNTTDDILVNGNQTGNQQDPSVSCFSDGSFVIAWTSYQTGSSDIYIKIFNSTGYNKTDDILVNVIRPNNKYHPKICSQGDGSFVVTWYGNGIGDTAGVFTKIFNSSGYNTTDVILVNSVVSNNQRNPSICSFFDNSFIISWCGLGPGDVAGIFAKIFNSTGFNQTGTILVNENITGIQEHPSVSCFSDKSFVIAWHGAGEGDDVGIFLRKFNSLGQAQSNDIRVNANTTNNQEEPAICCLTNGILVVTWQSNQDGGGDWDVYFRMVSFSTENNFLGLVLLLLLQPNDNTNIIFMSGIIIGLVVIAVLIVVLTFVAKRK
ncbi:MAG: hypothetical protein ACTSRG_05645 [Candidatus Helarchaeota archaeon]